MKYIARFILAVALSLSGIALACPFCTVESQTLSEEIDGSDAAVIAYLVKPALPPAEGHDVLGEFGLNDDDTGMQTNRLARIEKGDEYLAGNEQSDAVKFGHSDFEKDVFIRALANEDGTM